MKINNINSSLAWALTMIGLGLPVYFITTTGCGSESNETKPADDAGTATSFGGAGSGVSNAQGCDSATKTCTTPQGACGAADFACTLNTQCCNTACVGG